MASNAISIGMVRNLNCELAIFGSKFERAQ